MDSNSQVSVKCLWVRPANLFLAVEPVPKKHVFHLHIWNTAKMKTSKNHNIVKTVIFTHSTFTSEKLSFDENVCFLIKYDKTFVHTATSYVFKNRCFYEWITLYDKPVYSNTYERSCINKLNTKIKQITREKRYTK